METDIFKYLKDDDRHIEDRLVKVIEEYPTWSFDRVLNESQKVFAAVKEHFSKKEPILINHLSQIDGLKSNLKKFNEQRDAVENELENVTMIHVNEPVFKISLEALLSKFHEHSKFCSEVFYPQLKTSLSDQQLSHISKQLEGQVLS